MDYPEYLRQAELAGGRAADAAWAEMHGGHASERVRLAYGDAAQAEERLLALLPGPEHRLWRASARQAARLCSRTGEPGRARLLSGHAQEGRGTACSTHRYSSARTESGSYRSQPRSDCVSVSRSRQVVPVSGAA